MQRKNIFVYLIVFLISQVILIAAVLFVNKAMPLFQIFLIVAMVIVVTFFGDFCIFGIINRIIQYNEDKIEIQHLTEMNQKNYQFYQFAVMQQKNIRFFYHDLSNHLMTLEILKEQGKQEELTYYSEKILQQYRHQIPQYKTGNVMLDILIQYYQLKKNGLKLSVEGDVPEEFDFTVLLKLLQLLSDECANQPVAIRFGESITLTLLKTPSSFYQEKIDQILQDAPSITVLAQEQTS